MGYVVKTSETADALRSQVCSQKYIETGGKRGLFSKQARSMTCSREDTALSKMYSTSMD